MRRIVNAIVEMRWSRAGVAGIANISEDVTAINHIAWFERAVAIEMRVVMNLSSWSKHVDDLSPELVGPYAQDDSVGCAEHGCTAGREDVDALVRSSVTAWRTPGVGDL